jgi:hypothetical protein
MESAYAARQNLLLEQWLAVRVGLWPIPVPSEIAHRETRLLRLQCAICFWKGAIRRFEKADRVEPPRPGVIVFTGNSSIRFGKALAQNMAPPNVVHRGFGGWQMAVVENTRKHPARFSRFVDLVQTQLPNTCHSTAVSSIILPSAKRVRLRRDASTRSVFP